jgi:hypothetical protein
MSTQALTDAQKVWPPSGHRQTPLEQLSVARQALSQLPQ